MADDWQVGDLALCVSHGPDPQDWAADTGGPAIGSVHIVTAVQWYPADRWNPEGVYLDFSEFEDSFNSKGFRKIRPLSDEERDSFLADLRVPVEA